MVLDEAVNFLELAHHLESVAELEWVPAPGSNRRPLERLPRQFTRAARDPQVKTRDCVFVVRERPRPTGRQSRQENAAPDVGGWHSTTATVRRRLSGLGARQVGCF